MTPARHLSSLGGSYPLPTSASNEVLPYAGFPQASSEIFHIALLRHAPASNYAMSLIVYSNNAKVQSLSRVGVLSGVVSVVPLCALISQPRPGSSGGHNSSLFCYAVYAISLPDTRVLSAHITTLYTLRTHGEVEIRKARSVRFASCRQAAADCSECASIARALPRLAGGVAPARRIRREAAIGKVRVRTRWRPRWRLPPAMDCLSHGDAIARRGGLANQLIIVVLVAMLPCS